MLTVARVTELKGNEVSVHTVVPPEEAADRLAIRELIDAYAYCADGRDAEGQMALFSANARFVVYMDPRSSEPTMDLHSRAELAPVFDNLNVYEATTHFNGQSTDHPRGRPSRRRDATAWRTTCLSMVTHGRS